MAFIVWFSVEPRYVPAVSFSDKQERVILDKYRLPSSMFRGINPDDIPSEATLRGQRKKLPDFLPIFGNLSMRVEAKDLIESLEPQIHQFLPVHITTHSKRQLVYWNGRPIADPYFYLNIRSAVDAICLELSDKSLSCGLGGWISYVPKAKVCVFRHLVDGHHVWRGLNHYPTITFFSNELVQQIRNMNWVGLEFEEVEEV